MFTSTNPRPFSHYYREAPTRYIYTEDISRFNFNSEDYLDVIEVFKDNKQTYVPRYRTGRTRVSSEEIFKNTKILPYTRGLPRRTNWRIDRKFQEAGHFHSQPVFPRRRIYRITDTLICDEYGRCFVYKAKCWHFRPLNLGTDHRATTTIDGMEFPSYYWPGLAGLRPDVQSRIADTPSIEIHHTTENTYIFSPSLLAPLPAWLHRDFVHYTSKYGMYDNYFRIRMRSPYEASAYDDSNSITIDLYNRSK